MAIKHHGERDGDPGLIYLENDWELLISSENCPSIFALLEVLGI